MATFIELTENNSSGSILVNTELIHTVRPISNPDGNHTALHFSSGVINVKETYSAIKGAISKAKQLVGTIDDLK